MLMHMLAASRSDIGAFDKACSCCSVYSSLQALDARQQAHSQRLRLDKARRRTQQLEQDCCRAQQHTTAKRTAAQLTQKILALQARSLVTALEAALVGCSDAALVGCSDAALVGCSDAVGTFGTGGPSGNELN